MTEWISIIQKSFFVLANESAATHIAASCAKKCVCIGEQKFADKWLPYRPEFIREDDQIPIVVRSEKLACSFCVSKGWFTAPECRACIKEHGVSRCVYEVTAEMVIKAVDEVMQSIT